MGGLSPVLWVQLGYHILWPAALPPGWHVHGEAPSPVFLPGSVLAQQPGGAYGHLAGVL